MEHPYLASGGAEAMISPPGIFVDGTPEVSETAGELVGKLRQEQFDGAQKAEHRDRLWEVPVTTAVEGRALVPSHGECRYCNDRNSPGALVTSQSTGHFQPGYFG